MVETLELGGSRHNQPRRADPPFLVLVPSGQEPLVRLALKPGADRCRVLAVHSKELASMLTRVRQGNRLNRHTLNLDHCEDRWWDNVGQGESHELIVAATGFFESADTELKTPTQPIATAFDVDPVSLLSLQVAFRDCQIEEVVQETTAASLTHEWNLETANLLVGGAGSWH